MEQYGLEALSRGAEKAILCDKSKEAIKIIKKNIEKTHLEEKTEIYQLDYQELLENKIKQKIDIIYIDPPYKSDYIKKSIEIIIKQKLVNDQSKIIIETDEEERVLKEIEEMPIQIIDRRKYGRARIIILTIITE